MVYQLPYSPLAGVGRRLRPTIKVESNYASLRRLVVTLLVASFVAEAMSRSPEVPAIPCVGVIETAAEKLVAFARDIAAADAQEFRNQFPAYEADIAGDMRKALDALRTDLLHRERYTSFIADMLYGERLEFDETFATVIGLAENAWQP